jgi:hypothetical protein
MRDVSSMRDVEDDDLLCRRWQVDEPSGNLLFIAKNKNQAHRQGEKKKAQ